jgi:hypothetical protein
MLIAAMLMLCVRSAGGGEAVKEAPRKTGNVIERMAKLRVEIAALDAQARSDSPEFEAELREWEGKVAEPPEWSVQKKGKEVVPEKIGKILAIEPSERSPADAATLARYFRPRSKTVSAAQRAAAAKRAELAALRREVR